MRSAAVAHTSCISAAVRDDRRGKLDGMRGALGLVLLAGCQVVFPLEKAPPDASDDAGQPTRRRKITINNPTGTPHREFPVSITTKNDADLMMYASESGEDLRFVLGGSVQLAKEIVRFDKATGTLDAWVRIQLRS